MAEMQGRNIHERELVHTSLSFIAEAYDRLRESGVPRSRIITIVQLKDFLRSPHLSKGTYPYSMYEKKCGRMLREGGADYDYAACNPATLWAVLLGQQSDEFPKVVPRGNCSMLFLAVYSHGDSHQSTNSDEERRRDQAPGADCSEAVGVLETLDWRQHEWFFHFPYPAGGPVGEEMRSFIATERARAAGRGRNKPDHYFYATQFQTALIRMFADNPGRPVVGLMNFCRSGGFLDFMRRPAVVSQLECDRWPLFLMSSSQANHDALVGGLWSAFFECLLRRKVIASGEAASGSKAPPPSAPLRELVDEALKMYYRASRYELKDILHTLAYTSVFANGWEPPLTQSDASHVSDCFIADCNRFLVGGEHGMPDFDDARRVQKTYRDGSKFGFPVYMWNPSDWGKEVDLAKAIVDAQKRTAMPEVVWGRQSGIASRQIAKLFSPCAISDQQDRKRLRRASEAVTETSELQLLLRQSSEVHARSGTVDAACAGEKASAADEALDVPTMATVDGDGRQRIGDAWVRIVDAVAASLTGTKSACRKNAVAPVAAEAQAAEVDTVVGAPAAPAGPMPPASNDQVETWKVAVAAQLAMERTRELVVGPNSLLASASCFNWALAGGVLEQGWPEALFDWVSVAERLRHPWRSEGRPWKHISYVEIQRRCATRLSFLPQHYLEELDDITLGHCQRCSALECSDYRRWEIEARCVSRKIMGLAAKIAGMAPVLEENCRAKDTTCYLGMRGKAGVPANFSHWWLEIPTGRLASADRFERVRCETCPGAPIYFSPVYATETDGDSDADLTRWSRLEVYTNTSTSFYIYSYSYSYSKCYDANTNYQIYLGGWVENRKQKINADVGCSCTYGPRSCSCSLWSFCHSVPVLVLVPVPVHASAFAIHRSPFAWFYYLERSAFIRSWRVWWRPFWYV